MTFEKATYSYEKFYTACKLVKGLKVTSSRKAGHFSNACEVKAVCEACYDLTGCILFRYDWAAPVEDYLKAAYDYKSYTGKELEQKARAAVRYLKNELTEIHRDMQSGEVNSIA